VLFIKTKRLIKLYIHSIADMFQAVNNNICTSASDNHLSSNDISITNNHDYDTFLNHITCLEFLI